MVDRVFLKNYQKPRIFCEAKIIYEKIKKLLKNCAENCGKKRGKKGGKNGEKIEKNFYLI